MIEVDEMTERTLKRIQAEVSEGVRGAVIEGNGDIARGFDRLQKSLQQESTTGQNVIKRSADTLQDELLRVKEDVILQIEDFSLRFKAIELDFKIITAMEAKLVHLEESIIVSKSQQLRETHSLRDQLGKCEVSIGNQLTKHISEIDEKMNSLHELVNVSSSSIRSEMVQFYRSLELKLIAALEERLDLLKETYLMSQGEQQRQTKSLSNQLDQYATSIGNQLSEQVSEAHERFNSLQEQGNLFSSSVINEMGHLMRALEPKLIAAQEERVAHLEKTHLTSQGEQQKQTQSLYDKIDQYAASSGNRLTEHITEVNAQFNSLQEIVNVSSSSVKSEMGQLSQTLELVRKEILWVSQPFYKRWFGRRQDHE